MVPESENDAMTSLCALRPGCPGGGSLVALDALMAAGSHQFHSKSAKTRLWEVFCK